MTPLREKVQAGGAADRLTANEAVITPSRGAVIQHKGYANTNIHLVLEKVYETGSDARCRTRWRVF